MNPSLLRPSRHAIAAALLATVGLLPAAHALEAGQPAPAFILPTADGKTVSLAALRGHYVYVDFWASWCGPCKQSFPWMKALQAKLGGPHFEVVAINVDEQQADARRFLGDAPAGFTVLFDARGATPAAYGVEGMPTSFLVDPDGKVVLVHQSFKDSERDALAQKIAVLVGGAQP
ncbi:MAG: thiol:disulfide interchange protein [Xanthomonadaceae bacterium]|nr:thiol:disulfide interchange protein [Xanthomonadaceae bacterium]